MTSEPDAQPAFSDLELPASLLKATDKLGFLNCTEIQGLTLPFIVQGHDIAGQAQTGTGKTAAFLLGGFARLLENDGGDRAQNQPRMLVIAPTRELAMQIKKDADELGAHTDLRMAVVYGGIDYEKQRKQVARGCDVLIGTPGRLIDYFKQKIFDLRKLEIVVLDEADRMFDLGFIADIRFLLRRMPEPGERLSMLFSATLSHRVMELAYEHMDNPRQLKTVSTGVTAEGVRQQLFQPASDEKIPLLLGLLRDMEPPRAIIFVNTKRVAERVESYLIGNDIACGTLSGDVRQNKRQKILADFTAGNLPILIATDVAARGLHVDDVSHVFNYDLPQQAEDYVHRIGRTARAGTRGEAVSFACEEYSFSLPEIEEYIGKRIPMTPITDEILVDPKRPARIERDRVSHDKSGKRGGKRRGKRDPGKRSGRGHGKTRQAAHTDKQTAAKTDQTGNGAAQQDKSSASAANQAIHSTSGEAPQKKKRHRRRRAKKVTTASSTADRDINGNKAE